MRCISHAFAMSRYISVPIQVRRQDELMAALDALDLPYEVGVQDRLMLEGCLESAGRPVDLRVPSGTAGSSQDFGFVRDGDAPFQLICGDVDRALLSHNLVGPVVAQLARIRLGSIDTGLEEVVETDGTRRLLVRSDGGGG